MTSPGTYFKAKTSLPAACCDLQGYLIFLKYLYIYTAVINCTLDWGRTDDPVRGSSGTLPFPHTASTWVLQDGVRACLLDLGPSFLLWVPFLKCNC